MSGPDLIAWKREGRDVSLPEVHRSIVVPGNAPVLEKDARLCRAGLSGGGRLHGPGQLGDRPGRRRAVRLHPAVRHPDFQPHGHPAPAPVHQARRRHRARSGAGLPRSLLEAHGLVSLDSVRTGHRRLRSGRGRRLGHRPATAFRHPAGLGLRHHLPGRARRAVSAEQGLPLHRGAGRHAHRDHRRLFRGGAVFCQSRV